MNRRECLRVLPLMPVFLPIGGRSRARAASGWIQLTGTSRGTHLIAWDGGALELNLAPMSTQAVETSGIPVGYTRVRDDAGLYLPIADLVGITALRLTGSPPVPRILWDNREHQFWSGFEGSFEPRNAVVNEPRVEQLDEHRVRASYYFIANQVKTSVSWDFTSPAAPECRANWTATIEVQNCRTEALRNYLQFFACYHQRSTNYYWDASNQILACPDGGFTATATERAQATLRTTPYQTHMDRYREQHEITYAVYRRPVLLSGPEPCFGGLRHITLSQPATCAGVVTWNEQARDYLLHSPSGGLKPRETFRARIRHLIARADSVKDLERLWNAFESDLHAP